MPKDLPINYQQAYLSSGKNINGSSQQSSYSNYSQYPNYSSTQIKPPSPQKNDSSQNNSQDFQRFYGPVSSIDLEFACLRLNDEYCFPDEDRYVFLCIIKSFTFEFLIL